MKSDAPFALKKTKAVIIRVIHSSKKNSFAHSEMEVFCKKSNPCMSLKMVVKFLKGIDLRVEGPFRNYLLDRYEGLNSA